MGVQLGDEQQAVFSDIGDANFTDLDLAYHVRDTLKSVRTGECDSYHELIGVLHHTERLAPDEVAMLVTSLKALSGAVSYIDPDHHNLLLNSISGMSLWNYGVDVMDVLVELIVSLAAVNGKHLGLCLGMLVRNFVPPPSFLGLLKQPRGLAKKDQVLYRVHSAFKDIADLVPLAPSILEGIIKEKMPYKNSNQPWILSVIYVENMFKLESGAMGELVGSSMLVEVVNRLVELDVDIEWVDLVADDSNKGIFDMEFEDQEVHGNDTEIVSEELPKESFNQKFISGNEVAEHLDLLMLLTFEHLKSCYESGRLSQVFDILLQSFGKTVLRAYKSKFSQFVMFYACSLDPEHCGERFASWLTDFFTNRAYAPEWRMGAVAYLGSYLSRAKFIPVSYVITMVESLVDWCTSYCKNQYGDVNPRAHRVFYSGIQAVMYILCFRMSSMMGIPRLKAQLFCLPIEAILKHPLNPLKVCLPSIVHEFMQQAKETCLFNVSDVSLFNDMLEAELSRAFGGLERLDMFFPFDPYLLRNSDRYIRPNFIFWSMVRTTYADDDDDEDDDHSEGSIDEDGLNTREEGIAMSFDDLALSEFDNSLSKMSITPKNYRLGSELKGRMGMPSRIRPSASPESM